MRAVDTNLLVRLIVRDDPRQVDAAERFVAPGAWVSHVVLVETVWVLTSVYNLGPREIVTVVGMLLDHRELTVEDADTVAAALAIYRRRNPPDFSDCLILATAAKSGHLPLGTFDRVLGRQDGAVKVS